MVYQLTDPEHLVYSPQMQTSTIICKNKTSEIIHLDLATKNLVPENCDVKYSKHTITSTFSSWISSPPLQFTWAWDPFTLPFTPLDNPQHLDRMVNELRNRIYNIQNYLTYPNIFKNMLIHSRLTFNKTSIKIWLMLALTPKFYLILFMISFALYIKPCKNTNTLAKSPNATPTYPKSNPSPRSR